MAPSSQCPSIPTSECAARIILVGPRVGNPHPKPSDYLVLRTPLAMGEIYRIFPQRSLKVLVKLELEDPLLLWLKHINSPTSDLCLYLIPDSLGSMQTWIELTSKWSAGSLMTSYLKQCLDSEPTSISLMLSSSMEKSLLRWTNWSRVIPSTSTTGTL